MENEGNWNGQTPANVRRDPRLTWAAKVLYSEISALTTVKGYCFASNAHFAEALSVTPQAISRWVNELADAGYLRIQMIRDGKQVVERRIFIEWNMAKLEAAKEPKEPEGYQQPVEGYQYPVERVSISGCEGINNGLKVLRHSSKKVYKERENTTGEVESPGTSLAPLAPSKDDTLKCLKDSIRQSFLAVQPFGNYPRENAQVKRLADTVLRFFPDDPLTGARAMLESYYRLTKGRDKFWSSQPFTPSALVSLWDRVWTERTKTSGAADVSWLER